VVVVVTRWFGGTLLGTDRFKHIVNVAKVLIESKYKEMMQAEERSGKGNKLRTSEAVYNRIKWDKEWNVDDFIVGYEDRFVGIMEIPFVEFATSDVPFHRVRYFKRAFNDEIMWDRATRLDKIFANSGK